MQVNNEMIWYTGCSEKVIPFESDLTSQNHHNCKRRQSLLRVLTFTHIVESQMDDFKNYFNGNQHDDDPLQPGTRAPLNLKRSANQKWTYGIVCQFFKY